jgi:hypothetical protein
MRSTVEFFIKGSTLGEIMQGAKQHWRDFCGDENAALPGAADQGHAGRRKHTYRNYYYSHEGRR